MDFSHSLSRDGRVIIMSIHQPRYSVLKLCDSLTLLSKGAVVYQGITKEALPYFSTVLGMYALNNFVFFALEYFVGFRKNFLDNPADFFLDKIIAVEQGLNVPRQYKASDGMYACMIAYILTQYEHNTLLHMHTHTCTRTHTQHTQFTYTTTHTHTTHTQFTYTTTHTNTNTHTHV